MPTQKHRLYGKYTPKKQYRPIHACQIIDYTNLVLIACVGDIQLTSQCEHPGCGSEVRSTRGVEHAIGVGVRVCFGAGGALGVHICADTGGAPQSSTNGGPEVDGKDPETGLEVSQVANSDLQYFDRKEFYQAFTL